MYLFIVQRLVLEALLDIFYFPVWWYSRGFFWVMQSAVSWCATANRRLAPGLWFQNIFVPMYGQHDFTGRVVSFFMRLIQVVARSVVLGLFCVGSLFIVVIWLLWPVVVAWGITKSLFKPV